MKYLVGSWRLSIISNCSRFFSYNISACCLLKASLNWISREYLTKVRILTLYLTLSDLCITFEWILHQLRGGLWCKLKVRMKVRLSKKSHTFLFWAASKINWCADTNLFCSICIKWTLWKRSIFSTPINLAKSASTWFIE